MENCINNRLKQVIGKDNIFYLFYPFKKSNILWRLDNSDP